MRSIQCGACLFSVTEADRAWDLGRCPKCGNRLMIPDRPPMPVSGSSTKPLPGSSTKSANHVVVMDVRMPFESMVKFMVKWAIASIPAYVILVAIGFVLFHLFLVVSNAILTASSR
ncbi:MAG: hypothetical protein V2A76_09245 [Planctomycetota bacterium]